MSQRDMLENQVLEEVLREKITHYFSNKKSLDFWITLSPTFIKKFELINIIQKTNFYKQQKKDILFSNNQYFFACLISTNREFIDWIKLRLGYFEEMNESDVYFKGTEKEFRTSYTSDGITGSFDIHDENDLSILSSNKLTIHPNIQVNKYIKNIEIYYSNC